MFKRVIFLLTLLTVFSQAQAGVVTYNDRATFEAALASFTVDSLNGITQYGHTTEVRPDYTWTSSYMYGCINHAGCGNNSSKGFDNSYMWTYDDITGAPSEDTLLFSSAINAFGFDFDSPVNQASVTPSILGYSANATSGFFGLISDVFFTSSTITFDQDEHFMILDNITYGVAAAAPEPSMIALMLIGLLGLRIRKSV